MAELACSCPALVAILPPLYALIIWNQTVYQLEGLEEGLGTAGATQQGMVLSLGWRSPPLTSQVLSVREENKVGFKLSFSRLRKRQTARRT